MTASAVKRAVIVFSLSSVLVSGAIPEPDAVLYGTALVAGVPAQQQSSVLLLARLASGQEIGRFDFSDCNADGVKDTCELSCQAPGCSGVAGCGTARDSSPQDGSLDDCPGNLYALKIRCESTPDGLAPSGQAAVLNPADPAVVRITMQTNGGPEEFVRNFVISERGKIRQMALSVLNLLGFRHFAVCHGGPSGSQPGSSCTAELFSAADYDEDGDADLRDYAFIQTHFVGS